MLIVLFFMSPTDAFLTSIPAVIPKSEASTADVTISKKPQATIAPSYMVS